MSKHTICTIITGNYGHYALALYDSLKKYNEDVIFSIFISEGQLSREIEFICSNNDRIKVFYDKDVTSFEIAEKIKKKYKETYHDAYRWGMKPVFINYLLSVGFEKVIYVDCDIYFFNDYNFLFEELETSSVLLSPHWRSSNPLLDLDNFKLNFLDGIFNGGFIGATKGGIAAMSYWAELCLYNCDVNRNEGFYVDQKYLDILHSRFEDVNVIRHKGCNIANWNQVDCKRVKLNDGTILINGQYPIVFIHFTNSFFRGVLDENDKLLIEYLERYRKAILRYHKTDVVEDFYLRGSLKSSRTEAKTIYSKKGSLVKNILRKFKIYGC